MSLLYITIGIKHFINPDFFVAIVPPIIKWKQEIVFISGFLEIILGLLLLLNQTRKLAAWGIIILLIAVFPANIYLAQSTEAQDLLGITQRAAIIRLPLQIPLLLLAYWHSKR